MIYNLLEWNKYHTNLLEILANKLDYHTLINLTTLVKQHQDAMIAANSYKQLIDKMNEEINDRIVVITSINLN